MPIISSYRCYYYVVLFPTTPSSTWPVAGAARGRPARMKGNALMTLAVAWQGGTSKRQAASTEGSCSLSPHLAPASALAVAAGAAPLWAYGIINRDQCSLEDSALTGQCHYWTLSIVRQRATTPEGVGESIGSCRGTVTGCLIVVWFRRDRC